MPKELRDRLQELHARIMNKEVITLSDQDKEDLCIFLDYFLYD